MAALVNRICIGSIATPTFEFENEQIESVDYEENIDLIESELSVDVVNFLVHYERGNGADLTAVKYGTPIWFYNNGTLRSKCYVKTVERTAKYQYRINAMSAVGILSKQYHKGGVYTGVTFKALMQEMLGDGDKAAGRPPEGATRIYMGVDISVGHDRITLDGMTTTSFYFAFNPENPLLGATSRATYWTSDMHYNLPLTAGHTYRLRLRFIDGAMTYDGVTYTPTSEFPTDVGFLRVFLMKSENSSTYWWLRTLWSSTNIMDTPSTTLNVSESENGGLCGWAYSNVTYDNAVFETYLEDMGLLGYTMDEEVAETKLYGYLPYATKRDNLHQAMFAENISIVKNEDGDMHFTFVKQSGTVPVISQDKIFLGGSIKYPAIATRIELTEHSYQNVDTIEPVVLIDNSDKSPATNKLFVFEQAPIVISSLVATGDLTVVEAGVNYAIVTGQGVLTGRPYYDKQSTLEKTHSSGGEAYTVSVKDATLVTGINSENVAERLRSYYTSSETVNADIELSGEKCGQVVSFVDMFGDAVTAFITKMTSRVSSFIRAACQFVKGYVPNTFGNNYTHWGYVTGNTGTITIQEGTKLARFVIIGGGSGGSSGLKGIDNLEDLQAGGIGGEGGFGGNGGKIREVILHNPAAGVYQCSVGNGGVGGGRCSDTQTRNQGTGGSDSTVTTPSGTVYSTADSAAYYSSNGIKNLFTEDVYAIKGRNGCKGGNGGRGTVAGNGESGEDVLWDGVLYHGGAGGKGLKFDFANVKQSVTNGGAGGWGAQPYMDGANGGSVTVDEYHDMTSSYASTYKAYEYGKFGQAVPFEDGNPHTVNPSTVVQIQEYGEGGDGGHGGAGRGGFGSANDYYQSATDTASPSASNKKVYLDMSVNPWNYTLFNSSDGGAGNNGRKGIILCYTDKEVFF